MNRTAEEAAPVVALPVARLQRLPEHVFVEPVLAERSFEQAIGHLIEGIERARLRVTERLPSESELADQLQISKPTLRQALRVLERAGVIKVRRGSGGGIFLATDLIPVDLLNAYVASEEQQAIEVLTARRTIETDVARLATVSATEEDLEHIQHTVDLLERHRGKRRMVFRADAAFHRAVSIACHNRVLQAAMRTVSHELAPIRDAYPGGPEQDDVTLDIHRRQLHAMRLGDLDSLEGVLDEHFHQLEDAFAAAAGTSWETMFASTIAKLGGSPRRSS
ncbi:MAG: FCD domain-containing protein [Actinomycetota bacterium]|nr:FCD domain-containing protein [Actinomycetota bacterium]